MEDNDDHNSPVFVFTKMADESYFIYLIFSFIYMYLYTYKHIYTYIL